MHYFSAEMQYIGKMRRQVEMVIQVILVFQAGFSYFDCNSNIKEL